MDLLKDVFRSIRLEGSVFFNSTLTAPWNVPLGPSNHLRFHLVIDGGTWLRSSRLPGPIRLRRGDAVLLADGGAHRLTDVVDGAVDPRSAGGQENARGHTTCHLICGKFEFDGHLRHPLIDTLPPNIHVTISEEEKSVWSMVRMMADELDQQRSDSPVVVDRVCELLLIHMLRSHDDCGNTRPTFLAALDDPFVCRSLRLIHDRPGVDWTVESLAREVGISRSAFAVRFRSQVGTSPKAYLTTWRMHEAEKLLRHPRTKIDDVARRVGYSSAAPFVRAFKKFFGETPGEYRSAAHRGRRRRG